MAILNAPHKKATSPIDRTNSRFLSQTAIATTITLTLSILIETAPRAAFLSRKHQ